MSFSLLEFESKMLADVNGPSISSIKAASAKSANISMAIISLVSCFKLSGVTRFVLASFSAGVADSGLKYGNGSRVVRCVEEEKLI